MTREEARIEVGKRLKKRRDEVGYSQTDLALKLGYKGKTSICKIENGISDIPIDKIADLCSCLNVEPMYFLTSDNYIPDIKAIDKELGEIMIEVNDKERFVANLLSYARFLASQDAIPEPHKE